MPGAIANANSKSKNRAVRRNMRSSLVEAHEHLSQLKSAGKLMRCLFSGVGGTADVLLIVKGFTVNEASIHLEGIDFSFATIVLSGLTPPDVIDIGPPSDIGDGDIGLISPFLKNARAALRSRGLIALQIWVESGCFLLCGDDDLIAASVPLQ